ncbi:T9SS type B sorting domain-containing protein [Psychroserpens sp. Hel_I_66]|uniref:T9SS type B sorting domain-containing protein n=1 Tax=Psychroserpens sp. Hel_I_66 TaxID=1250004 RepID=UPI00064885A8|nr:T9SS type B sorting domain-containing protein [Psychroserpens sp. Hel_I_66]
MLNNLKFPGLLIIFFLSFNCINAQLEAFELDGEGWAKGDFIEFAINSKGVYGARTENTPASFHDNREQDGNELFGFLANPLADGWVDYDGDFFTPGSPEEGFAIEVSGQNFNNNNTSGLFQIPGEIKGVNVIQSDCFEDTAQITWEGNVVGLNLKRYYSITKDGLFIQMTTIITNVSEEIKEDVFFMHNVDPDNNVTLSGNYETDLELISQASSADDDICLVKASQPPIGSSQDMDGSNVSFYAQNEIARVSYGGFENRNASAVWNGTGYSSAEGDSVNFLDEAISIAFNLGDLEPGETTRFTYYYILENIDETFIPLIVNVFKQNPSVCSGGDGQIVLSGLEPGESYVIQYLDDGVLIPDTTYIADENGDVAILNLDAGNYTNLMLSYSGCSTNIDTVFELLDPEPPNYTITSQESTDCVNQNGVIRFSGLTPYTNYKYQYTYNGELFGPEVETANEIGDIILNDLSPGTYANFVLEQYECVTSDSSIIVITGPPVPDTPSIPNQFYCDEDLDYVTSIDLTPLNAFALGSYSSSTHTITYHETEQNAIDGVNISASNYTTSGAVTFTLYVKSTDNDSGCFSYSPFGVTINIPPDFELTDGKICLNSDDTVNLDYDPPILTTGLSNTLHSFEWYFEGDVIPGEISNELTATNFGNYSVKATLIETGCDIIEQAVVTPSGPPQTLEVNIISNPFSEIHMVEIIANGYGVYNYSIDNGPYQTSPLFSEVMAGYHEFRIIDVNGCGQVIVEKVFVDYMKVFTPNNDGVKDYWQIIGVKELIQPIIYVYDRYGKLITTLNDDSIGWDGTLNGKRLPAADYWFTVKFLDDKYVERQFKSHFALKR